MNSRRRIFLMAATAALIAALFASCSQKGQAVKRGGTLVVGETSDYESLNPMQATDAHARDIYNQLFLLLLDENPDLLTFSPRLAESWEFSPDRTRLTFRLRDDVRWSDGEKVTSRDVLATFKLQIDPEVLWSSRHLKKSIDSVTAEGEYAVTYHFNKVYPYQVMDAVDGPILPAHFLEKFAPSEIKAVPIEEFPTDGPFRVGEWVRGQSLTLVPNPGYYDKDIPRLDKVIFKIIPDCLTLSTQLKSGEIDAMEMLVPADVQDIRDNHPQIKILEYYGRGYTYIGWNATRPPFESVQVRRALGMAIDRKMIIDNLFYGLARECVGPFPPVIWAYSPEMEPIPFDPAEARRLLAAEGFVDSDGDGYLDRDGKRFEFELLANQGNQIRADIQVLVQEQLRTVGIKVTPVTMEWTVMLARQKASEFDAVIGAWRASTKADLSAIWACESRGPDGYNRVDYCNPLVDSLNTAACAMLDFEEARPLFHRAQKIIYDEQPYTFLYVPSGVLLLHERFRGAKPDAISSIHNMHEWWTGEPGR